MSTAEQRERKRAADERWKLANPEEVRAKSKRWKTANPEKVRTQQLQWLSANQDKARGYHLKRKFGITLADYETLCLKQKNRCAVCRTETPGGQGTWHVDHDHALGKTRGLLCQRCNMGLGLFQDSPKLLASASRYVRKHSQPGG